MPRELYFCTTEIRPYINQGQCSLGNIQHSELSPYYSDMEGYILTRVHLISYRSRYIPDLHHCLLRKKIRPSGAADAKPDLLNYRLVPGSLVEEKLPLPTSPHGPLQQTQVFPWENNSRSCLTLCGCAFPVSNTELVTFAFLSHANPEDRREEGY